MSMMDDDMAQEMAQAMSDEIDAHSGRMGDIMRRYGMTGPDEVGDDQPPTQMMLGE
jgi:hypothetical protein